MKSRNKDRFVSKRWKGFKQPTQRCGGEKISYDKKGAQTAANKRYREDHTKLRIYACKWGDHWHVTKELEVLTTRSQRYRRNRHRNPNEFAEV